MSNKIYHVSLTKAAEKALAQLPKALGLRVATALSELKKTPRPHGCKKLSGHMDAYRIRIGDYRIVYEIIDKEVRIIIINIAHRREVYRSL